MADDKMTGFSSAFDALMERTRQRFEDHSAGTFNRVPDRAAGSATLRAVPSATVPPSPPASVVSPPKPPEISTRASSIEAPPKPKRRKSEAARRLNERFGEGWSYQVTERRREGDELIVLCRVDIPDKDISKTQFGSAKVLKPGERFTLQGTTDGVPFGIAVGRGAPVTRNPEESAFRRAVDVALAKCAELL
ncbi:MAG: hypothetical protein V3S64_02465 [bacterium]